MDRLRSSGPSCHSNPILLRPPTLLTACSACQRPAIFAADAHLNRPKQTLSLTHSLRFVCAPSALRLPSVCPSFRATSSPATEVSPPSTRGRLVRRCPAVDTPTVDTIRLHTTQARAQPASPDTLTHSELGSPSWDPCSALPNIRPHNIRNDCLAEQRQEQRLRYRHLKVLSSL